MFIAKFREFNIHLDVLFLGLHALIFSPFVAFNICISNRHDKPTDPDDPLADQNIKDRFFGINDPVADKLMRRYTAMPKLEPPEDKTITTLYVGNLGDNIEETDLR
jgi:hypothetical protein